MIFLVNFFTILALICLGCFVLWGIKFLLAITKKQDAKKYLKKTLYSLTVTIIAIAGVGITAPDDIKESAKNKNTTLPVAVVNESEKEYYLTQTKPYIDGLLKKFDGTWSEFWKGTANKYSNSQITTKQAIDQYTLLKVAYQSVREKDMSPPVDGLSKDHQLKIDNFIANVENAILKREKATDHAISALQKGNISNMDKAIELIKESDTYIYEASIALVTLENVLDIDSKENSN